MRRVAPRGLCFLALLSLAFSSQSALMQEVESRPVRFTDGGLLLACTLEDQGSAAFHFDRAAFAINHRWEAQLSFIVGQDERSIEGFNELICPLTVDRFAWDPKTDSNSFLMVDLRRQPCRWQFFDSGKGPALLPQISFTLNLPREGHPEDHSFVMLQWREDIIGEQFSGGCNLHTRHLEPLEALKAGTYRIRDGRPHVEKDRE